MGLVKIKEICSFLESKAPLYLQENYDNSGLIIGNDDDLIQGILITLDITYEIIDEAIAKNANLIISHHPLIFTGIKKITTKNTLGKIITKCLQNNIAIYAAHTNFDNVIDGVNGEIAKKLNLINCRILKPLEQKLCKIIVFVPTQHVETLQNAMFTAGAGEIGNYDSCSFNTPGYGTFKAEVNAHPFVGETGSLHKENETKIETIAPINSIDKIVQAIINVHPYEEPAYDIIPLNNSWQNKGAGIIGNLENPIHPHLFFDQLKEIFNLKIIKHTRLIHTQISKIAICGGSGAFLVNDAIRANADILISADFKYHQYFDADNKIIIADIGHFESEQFTKQLFYELITKNFSNFAVYLSEVNTNPIIYY